MSSPNIEANSNTQTGEHLVSKSANKNSQDSSSSTSSIMEDEKMSNSNADSTDSNDEPIDPKDLDWDGLDDPDNPHNWPSWKKWYATMSSALLCLVVTMGSSLYVSSVPELVARYHVSQTLALSGLTFYLLGLATVIGAPLSEVFGRKPVYLFSLPASMLFTMGVGLSNGHMRIILPLRFLSGVFASPALSVGSGTILDIFDVDQVSVAMTYFVLSPFLGPVLSPIMAGFATEAKGWRWSEWIQLIAGGLVLPFIATMPETHKGIILKKRAKKRNMVLKKFTREDQKAFIKTTVTTTILRPLKMLVVEPIVFVFSIYVAFIFAILFGFFEAYAVIYRGVYHMGAGVSGLPFIGIGVGLWVGAFFYLYTDRKYLFPKPPAGTPPLSENQRTSKRTEPFRGARNPDTNELLPIVPEKFLIACKFGSVALPIGLFWQAWTARPDVHWIAPVAAGVPFGFGLILIFFSVLMYFSTCYPPLTVASCLAANNLLRYVMSSVFPLFTIQMYTKMKIKWASTLFALLCVVMIPIPWVFEKWGSKLRHKSQFGYSAMQKEAEAEGDVDDFDTANGEMNLTRMATLRTMETDPSTGGAAGERLALHRTHTQTNQSSFKHEGTQRQQKPNEPISNSLFSAVKDTEDGYSYTEMTTDASARIV
ncbi:Polyamine transporter 4 [Saccharomyces pastorianus]|uniref:Polyamine transporter 4 n=1 Tax=Saccharomyces pastorianus TaxID=27292 RepID=A0A6C1E9V1_SACPS|nr:Polyamine transporter 4 [Saccharomyces pastorianus]